MIFNIHTQTKDGTPCFVLEPVNEDAWDVFQMLCDCYADSGWKLSFPFYLCCFNGYDNAVWFGEV
jgi:hypothetical protein